MLNKLKLNLDDESYIERKKYYSAYTILFIMFSFLVYGLFFKYEKSFIYCDSSQGGDGLVQHFNSFVYYGRYLREIVKTLLIEHKFDIPLWDMRIGFGQDIITTLSYYVIGDPFALLSFFFPGKYAEIGYCIAVLLRIYFAGITFSAFCRYKKQTTIYTLIGTFIYIFSSYTLYTAILHPYFVLPLIYLPLLLLGVEKIFIENKDGLFIFAVTISAVSNFYFFYMLCIIVFIYVIFRYIEIKSVIDGKEVSRYFLRFLFDSLLGIIMASVLFIPSIINILSSSRISGDVYVPLLYSAEYYLSLFGYFFMGGGSYYVQMGYTGVAFLAIIVLYIHKKEKREYIFSLLLLALLSFFLLIPYFGHLFNGFSYVTNRWIWAMTFMIAYIVVQALPLLKRTTLSQWKWVLGVAAAISCPVVLIDSVRTRMNLRAIILLVSITGIIFFVTYMKKAYIFGVALLLTVFSITYNSYMIYSPFRWGYIGNFTDTGRALSMLKEEVPEKILSEIDDESIYRFDTIHVPVKRNSSMQTDTYGTSCYFSAINPSTIKLFSDLGLNYPMEHTYSNVDGRSFLDYLLGVKYIIIPNGGEGVLPFNYNQLVAQNENYSLYKNSGKVDISFSSDNYINTEVYESLSIAEKQQALLKGIVVESSDLKEAELDFTSKELNYEIVDSDNVYFQNNQFVVKESGATATLTFENISKGELYLVVNGLDFEGEANAVNMEIVSGSYSTTLQYFTDENSYYADKHNFLCNLYYADEERNYMTITFSQPGIYSFPEMELVFQPIDVLINDYEKISADTLENIKFDTNQISGSIDLEKNKLLCLSIPYSEGWSAVVDGEAVEIKKADNAFIAIELTEGEHSIVFEYETPWLKESVMISLVGILGYIILLNCERRGKNIWHFR